jgi:signal transduction histidine kinase
MSTGKAQTGQIRVGERIFEVHSYPILFEQSGHVTNVVNQYVDITQSRDLYLRLLQSEKLGAIGSLAGNIAHELNNPLTGLRSLSQVLLHQVEEGSSLKSDLVEIEKAAGRSQQIIKNLLEFSQGGPQQKRVMNIDDIVNKTMPLLKTVMRIHRQDIQLNAADSLIEVEPHFIQQVVFNLVNNACQAMKDPGTLSVRTEYLKKEKRVLLEISDTGSGIAPELQEKIFEPFFTTKKEGLGTGLGLSLTKKIVETMGGEIRVFSEMQKGSRFQVIFPEAQHR